MVRPSLPPLRTPMQAKDGSLARIWSTWFSQLYDHTLDISGDYRPVFDIRTYGAEVDDVTDDAAAIQAAIDAAEAAGGGTVYIPGRCAIASGLTIDDHHVILAGVGGRIQGNTPQPPAAAVNSRLKWTGGSSEYMLRITSETLGSRVYGCGVHDLFLWGQNTVRKGVKMVSANVGDFRGLSVFDCTEIALEMTDDINLPARQGGLQRNVFHSLDIAAVNAQSMIGIKMETALGSNTNDAAANHFADVDIRCVDGDAVQFYFTDHNYFLNLRTSATGTGGRVLFANDPQGGIRHSRYNVITHFNPAHINTPVLFEGDDSGVATPSTDNMIQGYNRGNDNLTAVWESGATGLVYYVDGRIEKDGAVYGIGDGYIDLPERTTAPDAPASGMRFYVLESGGKRTCYAQFPSGSAQEVVSEP